MSTTAATARTPGFSFPVVLGGGLAVAVFDVVFACTYWAIARGVPPIRIFQSIASGWFGEASFAGGLRTASIGAASHAGIAIAMVLAYVVVATRLRVLLDAPWRMGALYGVLLYGAMNFIVVPLSAASPARFNLPWIASSIVVHVAIGIACAFIARRAVR